MLEGADVSGDLRRRMVLPLVVVYLGMLALFSEPGELWWDLLFGVVALLLTGLVANLWRRRPPLARITHLGPAELVMFAIVPAVLESVFVIGESQFSWAERVVESLIPVTFQVVILLGAWAVVWSGAASIVVWLLRELSGSVGQVGVTLARTLPLLLGVVTFFFLAAEVWQSVGKLQPVSYSAVMLLFVGLGAVFLSSRSQLDLDALSRFSSREEIATLLAATSVALTAPEAGVGSRPDAAGKGGSDAAGEGGSDAGAADYVTPLGRRQRLNLRLVVSLSKLTVASTVAAAVFVFFVVLGFLSVDVATAQAWIQGTPHVMFTLDLLGEDFALTREHVKVAGFLAVFSGFYFAVVSATDAHLRAGLRDTAVEAVREACAARVALLHRRPGPVTE